MGLEVHLEHCNYLATPSKENGTREMRCRECSITTSSDQHAKEEEAICFTCGLLALTGRVQEADVYQADVRPEPLKVQNAVEDGRGGLGPPLMEVEVDTRKDDLSGHGQVIALANAASRIAEVGSAGGQVGATPKFSSSERAGATGEELGLHTGTESEDKLGVGEGNVEKLRESGIGLEVREQPAVHTLSERQSSDAGVDTEKQGSGQRPKAPSLPTPEELLAQSCEQPLASPAPEANVPRRDGMCVHCKGKPVFNKKESLCKSCAHAKWRYGWEEFPPGWKPGDRLKGIEKKARDVEGKRPSSPGKRPEKGVSKLDLERDRVLTQGWRSITKRERTTGRILKTGRTPSWTKFGREAGHFPWDKPDLDSVHGGGKGVLAALLAAEGSGHMLDRKLADSLSRKGLSPRLLPSEAPTADSEDLAEKRSGIEILQAAANQERVREQGLPGARSANFSRALPRLEMVNKEEEEALERVRIMSPEALQQTAYPNEPASLVKVAVAAQVLLEIATSPRDPPNNEAGVQDENQPSDQWKKPPPSRFVVPPSKEAAASSLGPDSDDLRSRVDENQSSHAPSKWGDHELDDLPLRSPDLDVHDEMQMGGEAVTLEDLGVLENARGGSSRAVTLPIQTGVFPPRIVTDGWTPRLDTDPLTLGTATDGWTPHQDLEGFTPRTELNGLTPRGEGDWNSPRNKTPSFHDIAANVFKAGRAALAGRRGGFKRREERPASADAKSKSPLGEESLAEPSPRRERLYRQPSATEELTPPEDDGEDDEMSPSAHRRKRKLKARQAQDSRPGETASGEEGKQDSGGSEQDAPIVSPGVHKKSRTRAVFGRSVSGNERHTSGEQNDTIQAGQSESVKVGGRRRGAGSINTPGKGPSETGKKRKGSWGGARKRGEKVVLPDSEEEEAILPRIESASEANQAKRPRPTLSEDTRKAPGGGGLLDLVKGRWDDAQRLRDRATAKRAEAERLKRVAEGKQRLAQRLIERATDLGNWPPGRKAKADERARRQQAAKKRNASETETEDEFEAAHSDDSDEEEDYSFDEDPSGTSPEKEIWEREGAGSDREPEEDSEKMQSLDQACTLPDQERCVRSDGQGWRCSRPRHPGLQKCDRHGGASQLRSQTKSETDSRRPEEAATADSCPPFLDPLEPFKPKKHFGFRERTSFRPEHLHHLAVRPPGTSPDVREAVTVEEAQPLPSREGFLHPEELLRLAKARQLKRARSARRHQPGPTEASGTSVQGTAVDGAEVAGGEHRGGERGGAVALEDAPGGPRNGVEESGPQERKSLPVEETAGPLDRWRGDPLVEKLGASQEGTMPITPGDLPTGQAGGEVEGLGSLQVQTGSIYPGVMLQMVQSAAQTDAERPATAQADVMDNPVGVNSLNPAGVNPVKPASVNPVGGMVDQQLPNNWAGPWVGPVAPVESWEASWRPQQAGIAPENGPVSVEKVPVLPLPVHCLPNGLTSALEYGEVSLGGQVMERKLNGESFPGQIVVTEQKAENGINGTHNGLNGTHMWVANPSLSGLVAEPPASTALEAQNLPPVLIPPPNAPGATVKEVKPVDQVKEGNGVKEPKLKGTNGVHRASSKRDNFSGGGVTRSRAIEDGLPVGRTYTLPVELKLPVELRQPIEPPQPFLVQRGKRQTTKKKKRIPPPIEGIDDSMRCTKTGGSGWRCNQRRLEGYAKCERHMEIVAKRSRVEAKPVEEVSKEGLEEVK